MNFHDGLHDRHCRIATRHYKWMPSYQTVAYGQSIECFDNNLECMVYTGTSDECVAIANNTLPVDVLPIENKKK